MAMIYPSPMTKKLNISIDAVFKWSNVFVTKINAVNTEYEILVWDPSSWSCKLIFPQQRVILLTNGNFDTVCRRK